MAKIKVKNNWEHLTYFWNGKELDEEKGGEVTLQNGEKVPYRSVKKGTTVHDMGHSYSQTYCDLIATIDYNNQKIDVKLSELEILMIDTKCFKKEE